MVSPSYNLYWIKQRSLASRRIILVISRTANNFPFPFNQRSCNICFVVSCNDLAQLVKNTYIVSWIKNWSIEECILFIYLFIYFPRVNWISQISRFATWFTEEEFKKRRCKIQYFLVVFDNTVAPMGLTRKEVEFKSAHSISSLCRKY